MGRSGPARPGPDRGTPSPQRRVPAGARISPGDRRGGVARCRGPTPRKTPCRPSRRRRPPRCPAARPWWADLATWKTARDELLVREKATPARATPSPRPGAGCRWSSSTARSRSSGPRVTGPVPGPVPSLGTRCAACPLPSAARWAGLLDMTPYGRGEAWEGTPDGRREGRDACWSRRSDADGNATGARPAAPYRSGPAPVRPLWRPSAGKPSPLTPPPPWPQASSWLSYCV